MSGIAFYPPRDTVLIETGEKRVLALADRLWARQNRDRTPSAEPPITMRIAVQPRSRARIDEREVVWHHESDAFTVSIRDVLEVKIGLRTAAIDAIVSESLFDQPSLAARTLLEAPAAVLLARRNCTVLHAAAVAGPRGAIVIRGNAGAGKSTLTAAAWRAGLAVLADESLLVARDDHDQLAACVRDLTIMPDAARLLGIEDADSAFAGGEEKLRIDLFRDSSPAARSARRIATILLGVRTPAPARLTRLTGTAFREMFLEGEIPQERAGGDPDPVAASWSRSNSFRLDGAIDLAGAVALLESLAG